MILVREHIYEKFVEDSDPIQDLGIGIKHKIEMWIKEYKSYDYAYRSTAKFYINDDLTISVDGYVNLYSINLKQLPAYINFNEVSGIFWINSNSLTTLKGCPKKIGESFFCCDNKLKSLKYAPEYVGATFACENNLVKFSTEDVKKVCKHTGEIRV